MKVTNELWGSIPILHITPEGHKEGPLPTVIFLHGHTSAKEHNLHYAWQWAQQGVRVILPDALLHGERDQSLDEVQISLRFWEIVLTSIEELGFIHAELHKRNLTTGEPAVGGTSMGGITTLGALTAHPWIKAAAVMMGSGNYVELAKAQMRQYESRGFDLPLTDNEREGMLQALSRFDISLNRQAFNGRPVFFWHGVKDPTVPFEPTNRLFHALQQDYAAYPERLSLMKETEAAHAVSRKGMLAATSWITARLTE
ncbi:alpha/beta fold hydrolase [Planococcus maritimus]|uniref:alpha/beta fold hydrolase n=1 Tax=Planococcus maritimus TaxID=192421 RepID=UPI0007980449|nr:alpha/beta fold hydrolase [Planococcus maritimus]KYG59176.1 esterase [Planococcus maritimus]